MSDLYDHLFKVIIIGDWGVGKSNIILRITQDAFDPDSRATLGIEFSQKLIELHKQKALIQIWDTAGQDRYKAITSAYYRAAVGAILVYDISNRSSFDNLNTWIAEIKSNTPENTSIMLLGNKVDLNNERVVSFDEGFDYAKHYKIIFNEVSALTGEGVCDSFCELIGKVYENVIYGMMETKRSTSKLSFVEEMEGDGVFRRFRKGFCC